MTVFNDKHLINDASTAADWTTGGNNAPDPPKLNDTNATVSWYIEGVTCQDFPIKSNADGYTYDDITQLNLAGRLLVWWLYYPAPDTAGFSQYRIQLSSANGFTTNYRRWDALAQWAQNPGSFVPTKVYPTNPDASSGTPTDTIESVGLYMVRNATDNKAGAFDMVYDIKYIGVHSATYTNTYLSSMYSGSADSSVEEVLGVYSKAGDFYQTSISLAIAHPTPASNTANAVVVETGKTVYFDNVEPEQELGYIINNPDTETVSFTLTGVVHFWNSQLATHEMVQNPNNADTWQWDGSSFARGGKLTLPSHSTTRYTRNCKFDDCKELTVGDHDFTDNTITNADDAVLLTLANARSARNSYINNVDAVRVVGAGVDASIDLDGDQFSGNTYDIVWESTAGVLTVNALNGANPSQAKVRTTGTGSVVVNNAKAVTIKGIPTGAEYRLYEDSVTAGVIGTVELVGAESKPATPVDIVYAYGYVSDKNVVLQVIETGYEEYLDYFVLGDTNQTRTVVLTAEENI